MERIYRFSGRVLVIAGAAAAVLACTPKVEVALPEEPIVINMNIKIEHEVRVKVDADLEELFDEEDELF
jgi:hypothetical protein